MLRAVPFDQPPGSVLAAEMDAEMVRRYGDGGASPAAAQDFSAPHGVFLVAVLERRAVGCGGLRLLADGVGEVKRMYVVPAARGRGVARALLRGLLDHAREVGLARVQLETGTLQPEARGLYESEGFAAVPPYGHYRDDPRSRCYALDLT